LCLYHVQIVFARILKNKMNEIIDTNVTVCARHEKIMAQVLTKLATLLPTLNERSLKVFLACLKHLNAERLDFKMSVKTLVSLTGLSQATVYRGLENLVENGLITQEGIKRTLGPVFLTSLRTEQTVVSLKQFTKPNQPTSSETVLLSPALEAASRRKNTTEADMRRLIMKFGEEVVEKAAAEMMTQYPDDNLIRRSFAGLVAMACQNGWKTAKTVQAEQKAEQELVIEQSAPLPDTTLAVHKESGTQLRVVSVEPSVVRAVVSRRGKDEIIIIPNWDWQHFEWRVSA
jgi:DNA-binding transcriptional ArsR family regulator